ncbi:MAG TPA: glycosyltransferase [Candidatus Acidoferrales bacterium]|nr:glycosyltransferase [Candidatus Acidoferrales bacterium]
MLTAFFILAALLTIQSLIALQDGPRFLAFVRRRLQESLPDYAPPATLICPCKGLDEELEHNLTSLVEQDYPDLEVVFVMASGEDPARAVCDKVAAKARRPVRVVIAGKPEGRGEKVNNLLAGVAAARASSEMFVFADSDGRPGPQWVRRLVQHLADPQAGAASTFRWYLPAGDFLSGLQSAWNAPAVTYMGEWDRNFCWGGGTAIRRQTFQEIDAPRYWSGCISDDYMLTKALRAAGRRIVFVPQCLVTTHHATTWSKLIEWTTRQLLLTRVYEPRLWWPGMGVHVFYCGVFVYGLALAAWLLPRAWATSAIILLTLAAISSLSVAKGVYRLAAVQLLMPEHGEQLRRTWWSPTLQAALAPWLMALAFLLSARTRRLTWRGVTYELRSPWETRVLGEKA